MIGLKRYMKKLSSIYPILICLLLANACSLFLGNDVDEFKSDHYEIDFTLNDWKKITADESDHAYIKESSKSIIFINSYCKKHDSTTLDNLVSHLFAGIDKPAIEEKSSYTLFGREAILVKANGKLDGIQSYLQMFVVNKNRCTYDFILISTSSQQRELDAKDLMILIEGVQIE